MEMSVAILAGKSLGVPVSEVMNRRPQVVPVSTTRDEMLSLMRCTMHHQLPLIDNDGRVVGLATLDELIGAVERPNWVVLMAGGLGTRLQPLTDECPKPLLAVGGKPILETILELRRTGLQAHLPVGQLQGRDDPQPLWRGRSLGRAGGVFARKHPPRHGRRAVVATGKPSAPIVVMNGDLITRTNFENLFAVPHRPGCHRHHGRAQNMTFRCPYGVVRLDGARIEAIEEKPVQKFFVNAGIYALSPDALDHLPAETFFDMPTLFEHLITAGKSTAAFPCVNTGSISGGWRSSSGRS